MLILDIDFLVDVALSYIEVNDTAVFFAIDEPFCKSVLGIIQPEIDLVEISFPWIMQPPDVSALAGTAVPK
jgi:hypothetical protein